MANSTEEFWSITARGGQEVSLHQFGWAVTTVGGSRYDLPPRRGSDMVMAYIPGQFYRSKMPDARPITLLMFMVGWDPATGQASGMQATLDDQRAQWNDNWDTLRRLVYRNYLGDSRVTLTRRWRLTTPVFPTVRVGDAVIAGDPGTTASGVSQLLVASATAEMTGVMAPTMTGRTRADFQLDFTLADPYFYGDWVDFTVDPGATVYVWNDGHDVAAHANMEVKFVGPLTNPALTNHAMIPANTVTYNGSIPDGQTITLNIGRFTAYTSPTGAPVVGSAPNIRIANVVAAGARLWFNLMSGANKLSFSATGGGHVQVRFRPPYV